MARKRPAAEPPKPDSKPRRKPAAPGSSAPTPEPRARRNRAPAVSPAVKRPKARPRPTPGASPEAGSQAAPPAPAAPPPPSFDVPLTPREEEELASIESPEYATIADRRARVARYLSRKLTMREIAAAIGSSPATVYRDIKALDAKWMEEAEGERGLQRARELAELQDMERQVATAQANSQSEEARIRWVEVRLKLKARIAALMGLDAPKTFSGEIEVKDGGLSAQERRAIAARIAAMQGAGGRAEGDTDADQ